MSPETLFRIHLVLGYIAWLLCFGTYILRRLKAMDRFDALHWLVHPAPKAARALAGVASIGP